MPSPLRVLSPARSIGDDVPLYELGEELGRGFSGTVYAGRMTTPEGLSRAVAVKLLNADLPPALAEDMAARLRDEARLLAMVRHRALVTVHDLARLEGRWAVVMERVEGADLRRVLLRHRALAPRLVCQIAAEVAAALAAIHAAVDPATGAPLRLLHRDVKPDNVIVSAAGEVKLLDLGFAAARFEQREARSQGLALGALNYMAPERLEQDDRPAGDVYSLGVLCVACLAGTLGGQLPFAPDKRFSRLAKLMSFARVPPELQALVSAMIEPDPDARPTAAEVSRQMRELQAQAPGPWLESAAPGLVDAAPAAAGASPRILRRSRSAVQAPPGKPAAGRARRWLLGGALLAGLGLAALSGALALGAGLLAWWLA